MEVFASDFDNRIDIIATPQDFDDWAGLLALLQESFACMDGRIDPPSSLRSFDAAKLAAKAEEELILTYLDGALVGCLFAAARGDAFYLRGKGAVADMFVTTMAPDWKRRV